MESETSPKSIGRKRNRFNVRQHPKGCLCWEVLSSQLRGNEGQRVQVETSPKCMPPKVDQVQCKAKGMQERARGRAGVSRLECRHVGAQKGARPSPHLPWNLIGFISHTLPCRFSIPKALLLQLMVTNATILKAQKLDIPKNSGQQNTSTIEYVKLNHLQIITVASLWLLLPRTSPSNTINYIQFEHISVSNKSLMHGRSVMYS